MEKKCRFVRANWDCRRSNNEVQPPLSKPFSGQAPALSCSDAWERRAWLVEALKCKVKKPFWQVRDLIQKRLPGNGFLFEFKGLSRLTTTFVWFA